MAEFSSPSWEVSIARIRGLGTHVVDSMVSVYEKALSRVDRSTPRQRRLLAVSVSLILHLGVLMLMLPSQKGFLSIGTTGLGEVNGAGTAVTLVDATEIEPPQASPEQAKAPSEEPSEAANTQAEPEAVEAEAEARPAEAQTPPKEQVATNEPPAQPSDSQAPSDSTSPASAGAFGQNGEAYTDLWNAIAPCWNRIADAKTLPAKLTISFSPDGGLSAPPVIERDPDAEITDDSLHAEAKALQSLSECGPYPMAKDLQNVTVMFPLPTQALDSVGIDLATAMGRSHKDIRH